MNEVSQTNKTKTIIILLVALLVITTSVSVISIAYLLNNAQNASNNVQENDLPNEENENEDNENEENEQSDNQDNNQTTDNSTTDEDTNGEDEQQNDMASGWNTYNNSKWKFGLKYPKDMIYTESVVSPTMDMVVFGVGEFEIVTIYVINDSGTIDSYINNMLANQCTDNVLFSDLNYSNASFRKGVEVPSQTCLDAFGVIRTQDYSAYGYRLSSGAVLIIRNEGDTGLNNEQLEAFLRSVYFN